MQTIANLIPRETRDALTADLPAWQRANIAGYRHGNNGNRNAWQRFDNLVLRAAYLKGYERGRRDARDARYTGRLS